MSYFDKFEAQQAKLENTMEANGLLHKFCTDKYPMSLTISQNQAPEAQMALYEQDSGDGVSSRDAKLVLTFPVGEIGVRVYGRLIISDALMGKIKNHGKKMRDLWLQANFATSLMEERKKQNPEEPDAPVDEAPEGDFEEFFEDDREPVDEDEE